ncbi:protein dalmatian [Hyposmocoma kahamanoa]|uniref:protein dalmatian n=1 Tax=Hyposmocoma kahamanoa TaxID=1477025 RepID=UPI000E6D8A58|nr:protein dalmatian [Hyposmocoma kahamanoa]
MTKQKTTKTKKSLDGSRNNSSKTLSAKNVLPIFSFRVLENKNSSQDKKNQDIYEFTYDPNDEPPPQKKKKRRVVKKKPSKPKTVVFKHNYDRNLSKTLSALKSAVAKKHVEIQKTPNQEINPNSVMANNHGTIQISTNVESVTNTVTSKPTTPTTIEAPTFPERNKSVQIEDIAADLEISLDHQDLNYSPVNSPDPNCLKSPTVQVQPPTPQTSPRYNNDPLNLRDNLSFFDDQPVASSSMNMSVRHPLASPWRIEFESLPIKWHVNSYVKPNMTPAVECSFVNFEDSKKKHVYTNMVPQSNEPLPQIVEKSSANLVQPSIISFIKEVVEKSASKKPRPRSETPTACIFSEATNSSKVIDNVTKHTRQVITPKKTTTDKATSKNTPNSSNKNENSTTLNKQNPRESLKRKNDFDLIEIPAKTPRQDNNNYFGFDDSEIDQENVSPNKNIDARKVRALRPRAREVLKEINEQGPTRALLPLAVKPKDSERVNRLYEEMKSATDAPIFPDEDALQNEPAPETTNIDLIDNEDSQSVHLFEDIEFARHLNAHCKSYSKAKKVAFRQPSTSDSDSQSVNIVQAEASSGEEDDLNDLNFEVPLVEEKKPRKKRSKKQKMTKKERAEAEAWAANFNSMCEDVEDFPLVLE